MQNTLKHKKEFEYMTELACKMIVSSLPKIIHAVLMIIV